MTTLFSAATARRCLRRAAPALASASATALLIAPAFAQEAVIEEVTPGGQPVPARPAPKPTPAPPAFTEPRLLWKTLLKRIDSTPTLADGFLYLGAGENLYQLDREGRVQWTAEVGTQQAAPLVFGSRVVAGSDRGQVAAVRVSSGLSSWRFPVPQNAPVQASLAASDNLLFCLANNDNLYALTPAGQTRWKFALPDGTLGYGAPVADGKDVFLSGETSVYRLDATSGKQTWRSFLGGKALSSPALSRTAVFVGGDGTGLTALSRADGKTLWRFTGAASGDWFGPPLVSGNTVYVTTFRRYVYAVNARTGALRWSQRLSGSALAQPAIDTRSGTLYVTCATFADNPTLVALSAYSGKPRWDFRMGYVSGGPLVAGNRLYVGSTTGYLYAFALR